MLFNMDEAEWDSVIKVHLKGTFCPTRHAVARWREESKAGAELDKRIINTTSASGIYGNPGQANYGAAKSGLASFTIITSRELFEVRDHRKRGVAGRADTDDRRPRSRAARHLRRVSGARVTPTTSRRSSCGLEAQKRRASPDASSSRPADASASLKAGSRGPNRTKEGRWDPAELGPVVSELVAEAAEPVGMGGVPLKDRQRSS